MSAAVVVDVMVGRVVGAGPRTPHAAVVVDVVVGRVVGPTPAAAVVVDVVVGRVVGTVAEVLDLHGAVVAVHAAEARRGESPFEGLEPEAAANLGLARLHG